MIKPMAEAALAGVPAGHGVISKLTSDDGDFRHTWDPDDDDSVDNARQAFNDLRRTGYMLYKAGPGRREQMREFDPQAGQVVAVRPSRGG